MARRGRGYRYWFKVKIDILDDPKLQSCSADCFRFYIRLLAMLKRTDSQDGEITLSRQALNACAGREQRRHSLRVASEGAAQGLYAMSTDGDDTVICVRKWPEHQENRSPKTPRTSTEVDKRERRGEERGADASLLPPGAYRLSPPKLQDLIEMRPHGKLYSEYEVECWVAHKAPVVKAKGYKQIPRALANWWQRVDGPEVRNAVQWAKDCRMQEAMAEMDKQYADDEPFELTPDQLAEAMDGL
jgi:hypothetical protein